MDLDVPYKQQTVDHSPSEAEPGPTPSATISEGIGTPTLATIRSRKLNRAQTQKATTETEQTAADQRGGSREEMTARAQTFGTSESSKKSPKQTRKRRRKATKGSSSGLADAVTSAAPERKDPLDKTQKFSDFSRTDAGNAELFAELYGKSLRYDHKRKRWLVWAKHWWIPDKNGGVYQFAKHSARYRLKHAADLEDKDAVEAEAKWAIMSESRSRLESMLKLAQSEFPLADSGENWDRDPWLLGVANGVVAMRTGTLRHGQRGDRITMHTDVPFDTEATCDHWLKSLQEIFGNNHELIEYVQRSVGYCVTGSTQEQCIFYAHGSGANGKSTFLEALRYAVGPYAGAAPFSMFEQRNKASIPSDVAATAGKRFITASETDESVRLNESRIKSMTGGDKQTARFMYQDFFEFEGTAKIWLSFNHKPEIHDDSHGMWRRIRLIPFTKTFQEAEQDKHLKEKLRAEAPGILAWAIRGTLEWQERGLGEPKIVTEATEQYRAESDTIGAFTEDVCSVREGLSISSKDLWEAYEFWASENGALKLERKTFARRLESRGFKRERSGHRRTRTWSGISLRDPIPRLDLPALIPGEVDWKTS